VKIAVYRKDRASLAYILAAAHFYVMENEFRGILNAIDFR
jgi:hypothetical protein